MLQDSRIRKHVRSIRCNPGRDKQRGPENLATMMGYCGAGRASIQENRLRSGPNVHVALNLNLLPVALSVPRRREGLCMAKLMLLLTATGELLFCSMESTFTTSKNCGSTPTGNTVASRCPRGSTISTRPVNMTLSCPIIRADSLLAQPPKYAQEIAATATSIPRACIMVSRSFSATCLARPRRPFDAWASPGGPQGTAMPLSITPKV